MTALDTLFARHGLTLHHVEHLAIHGGTLRVWVSHAGTKAVSEAVGEMARIVRAGGAIVVVDFLRHDQEWMREELGVVSLGFELDEVRGWFEDAGLPSVRFETFAPVTRHRDLPATFIASARHPGQGPS